MRSDGKYLVDFLHVLGAIGASAFIFASGMEYDSFALTTAGIALVLLTVILIVEYAGKRIRDDIEETLKKMQEENHAH